VNPRRLWLEKSPVGGWSRLGPAGVSVATPGKTVVSSLPRQIAWESTKIMLLVMSSAAGKHPTDPQSVSTMEFREGSFSVTFFSIRRSAWEIRAVNYVRERFGRYGEKITCQSEKSSPP
jgi:hypothetical protein